MSMNFLGDFLCFCCFSLTLDEILGILVLFEFVKLMFWLGEVVFDDACGVK